MRSITDKGTVMLLEVADTNRGIGIAQHEHTVYIHSGCCGTNLTRQIGRAWKCASCGVNIRKGKEESLLSEVHLPGLPWDDYFTVALGHWFADWADIPRETLSITVT